MRSSTLSLASLALAASQLASAQTYTSCNPTSQTCPSDPAIGGTITTDFTAGESAVLADYTYATGTTLTYDSTNGGAFTMNSASNAPTISSNKYLFFGKVEVVMRAAPGTGIVSSFVLESDDLDEIDWEWLGSQADVVQTNFFGKGNTTTYDRSTTVAASASQSAFHTYTIDWNSDKTVWSVDGTVMRTLLYADTTTLGGKNYPQTPMRVKIGNWCGCVDAAAAAADATKGTCEWAGGPTDWSQAPFIQYVKSVTIQDYGCAESYSYGDMTGSFSSIVSTGSCNGTSSSSGSSASSASSSSAVSGASTKTTASSQSSSSGGVFAESSLAATMSTSTTAANGSKTTGTATSAGAISSGSGTATSSSSLTKSSSSSASGKPKHKYGTIDVVVIALGLGLGYLVM
ncbi:hypothetical protein BP5796_07928 [Coleophoma crateriformis]|uniref:Crh-like protein n=1 Tax=Coleophoma crateriformis TaxID=565419 RepID=A0A3D8RDE3_9HELO|nr:hypothetical protein BP5796_07928 [Coleophoma crateriformis]